MRKGKMEEGMSLSTSVDLKGHFLTQGIGVQCVKQVENPNNIHFLYL